MLEINYINYAILSPFTWEFPSHVCFLKEKNVWIEMLSSRNVFFVLQDKIVSDLRIILHAKQAGKFLENGNKSISLMIYLIQNFSLRFDAFLPCKRNFTWNWFDLSKWCISSLWACWARWGKWGSFPWWLFAIFPRLSKVFVSSRNFLFGL